MLLKEYKRQIEEVIIPQALKRESMLEIAKHAGFTLSHEILELNKLIERALDYYVCNNQEKVQTSVDEVIEKAGDIWYLLTQLAIAVELELDDNEILDECYRRCRRIIESAEFRPRLLELRTIVKVELQSLLRKGSESPQDLNSQEVKNAVYNIIVWATIATNGLFGYEQGQILSKSIDKLNKMYTDMKGN